MIDPQSIDLSALPWVPLSATAGFPAQPGIYFAIDPQNNIQYIGRSKDVRGRWKNHHRFEDLQAIGGVRISYLFIEAVDLLPEMEMALISWFNPPLNRARSSLAQSPAKNTGKMRIRQVREIEVDGLGERIKQARLNCSKSLEQICDEVGVSRTYWYDVEKETLKGALSIENLKKIEQSLGVDLGVKFDA